MGVHYERGSVGGIKSMGLVPATIDVAGAVTFQGGISRSRQSQLLGLIQQLQAEWDAAVQHEQSGGVPVAQHVPQTPGTSPTTAPAPAANGKSPAVPPSGGSADARPRPQHAKS